MSKKADCDENAMMESFFGSLKTECVDRHVYQSRSQAKLSVFE
jgi:putative transposase